MIALVLLVFTPLNSPFNSKLIKIRSSFNLRALEIASTPLETVTPRDDPDFLKIVFKS